jgi:hypothetical protein
MEANEEMLGEFVVALWRKSQEKARRSREGASNNTKDKYGSQAERAQCAQSRGILRETCNQ